MKQLKYFLPAFCLLFLALSMNSADTRGENASPLTSRLPDFSTQEDTLSQEAYAKYLQENLIAKVRNTIEELNPHLFMTKCYSLVYFKTSGELTKEGFRRNERIYKQYDNHGIVFLEDCGMTHFICEFVVNIEKETVLCKSSYTAELQPVDEFLKSMK